MSAPSSKSVSFRKEREKNWRELEGMIDRAERRGFEALSLSDRIALPKLYRATISALSVARTIALDRNLVEYLSSLSGRAYCCVYGARGGALVAMREYFASQWPRAIRAAWGRISVATLVLALGLWLGYDRTNSDPELYYAFVEPALAQGRDPLATTADLEKTIYGDDSSQNSDRLLGFAAFLFTHNAQVAFLAFSLGLLFGLPVLPLLFMTGAMLGAMHALFASRGLGYDFAGWILPHGITELFAIVIAGAAGLGLGKGMLFPGALSRKASLERVGRESATLMLGVVVMLLIAGIIEGIFRQTVTDIGARYSLAATTALVWTVYFGFAGRGSGVSR